MGTMVRYKIKPGRGEENESYIKKVYAELAIEQPPGLLYATFKLDDGVSFVHIAFGTHQARRSLNDLAAFTAFTAEIADRCDEPPVALEITQVGAYRFETSEDA